MSPGTGRPVAFQGKPVSIDDNNTGGSAPGYT